MAQPDEHAGGGPQRTRPGASVMAGEGVYNEHSQPQHVAGDDGVPMLVRACEAVALDGRAELAIVDYGSSQGRNSLTPVRAAIEALRARVGPERAISVFHTDLPSNDFAALFTTLADDPDSYLRGAENVFAYAAGRSFYERLFAASRVTLGWSSITVHWLSSPPVPLRGQIFSPLAAPEERAAWAARAAGDWRRFVEHRLEELAPGAQLVVVGSGADEQGRSGAEGLMELANGALEAMLSEGLLGASEYERMAIPTYYRTARELVEPLDDSYPAGSFTVEESTETDLDDPLWARFEQSGDVAEYAASAADFLRAFSEPSLFGAIAAERSQGEAAKLADEFYGRVRDAVAQEPERARCAWRLVLLRVAKREGKP